MCKQNLDLCVRELGLNYFQSCSLQKPKSFAKLVGNLIIKSKINREIEVPSDSVKLHIPAERCCVYEDEKLI